MMNKFPVFSAIIRGWLHKSSMIVFLTLLTLFGMSFLSLRFLLPVYPFVGTVLFLVLSSLVVFIVIIAGLHISKMDGTEHIRLQVTEQLYFQGKNPSVAVRQIFANFVGTLKTPDALIPPGVNPGESPSKFEIISSEKGAQLILDEIKQTFKETAENLQNPPLAHSAISIESNSEGAKIVGKIDQAESSEKISAS